MWARLSSAGQSHLLGRLPSIWPLRQDKDEEDDDSHNQPVLKYSQTEHQAAMVVMRKEYNEQIDNLNNEHTVEIDQLHKQYQLNIEHMRIELLHLEREVWKYCHLLPPVTHVDDAKRDGHVSLVD